jgi:syntaxin-binding protein 1
MPITQQKQLKQNSRTIMDYGKKNDTTLSAVTRIQLLDVMLGSVKEEGEWSVLFLDSFTTQIMSNICGISDLLDYGISLVENIQVSTQHVGQNAAVYFLTPTDANVQSLVSHYSSRRGKGLCSKVHIFFSTTPSLHHIEVIKQCPSLLSRLRTLKEANVEYVLFPDQRGFITGPETALKKFYGHGAELSRVYDDELLLMSQRLASLFVTMKEMPSIRYHAALPPGDEYPSGLDSRLLLTQRLAVELSQQFENLQALNQIPEGETCELLIIDRGFDAVSPVIHEWTYESLIHDVLQGQGDALNGRVFKCDVVSEGGASERKDHVLDDRDQIFLQLRHRHFADATKEITGYLDSLLRNNHVRKNKGVKDMDLRSMGKLVQSLPKFQDDLRTLNIHVEIASQLNKCIDNGRLTDIGTLEQDIVYGDATSKEIIAFLSSNQLLDRLDKLRLMLCYSSTHLEKLDEVRQSQWQKLARLESKDIKCLTNLEYLGIPVCKRHRGSLSGISFGRKKKSLIRRDGNVFGLNSQEYTLSRFVPLLAERIEEWISGKLSEEDYPFVRPPKSPTVSSMSSLSESTSSFDGSQIKEPRTGITSFRTMRPNSNTWAGKANNSSNSAAPPSEPSEPRRRPARGRNMPPSQGRMFVFIIGGFTYSELRVIHHVSSKLNKDVFIGGTSLLNPRKFIEELSDIA